MPPAPERGKRAVNANGGHRGNGSNLVTTTCAYCHAGFTYRRPPGGGNPRLYCTRRHKAMASTSERPHRACRVCGKSFVLHDQRALFCSQTCRRRNSVAKKRERCRARAAQLRLFPQRRCGICEAPVIRAGAVVCETCNRTHKIEAAYLRTGAVPDFALPPHLVLGLDMSCQSCKGPVEPQTEDGVLVDWCPACRRAWPVPVRGTRTYDQRSRLEVALGAAVDRERNPTSARTSMGKPTTRFVCGRMAPDG